jgi:hypothetical protein
MIVIGVRTEVSLKMITVKTIAHAEYETFSAIAFVGPILEIAL